MVDATALSAADAVPESHDMDTIHASPWIDVLSVSLSLGRMAYRDGYLYQFSGKTEWSNSGFRDNVLWLKARDLSSTIPCSSVLKVTGRHLVQWNVTEDNHGTAFSSLSQQLMLSDGMTDSGLGTWSFKAYKSVLDGPAGAELSRFMMCVGPTGHFTRKATNRRCTAKNTTKTGSIQDVAAHLAIQTKLYVPYVPMHTPTDEDDISTSLN